jgi:hypothetical protein
VLQSGWQGAAVACVIALSVLGSAAWSMLQAHRAALARGVQPVWSPGNVIGVLTGVSLLHLAMLFQLSLAQVALLWPLTATVVLWVALRMAHSRSRRLRACCRCRRRGVQRGRCGVAVRTMPARCARRLPTSVSGRPWCWA